MKWLDIKNWEGLYEISNTGLVRNKITNKLIIGDKNSNKDINEDWNLEWCSRKDNERHCIKYGSKQNKYKPFKVKFNNGIIKQYESKIDLANELNVTPQCVKQWLHKKTKGYLKHGVTQIYYIGNQSIKV